MTPVTAISNPVWIIKKKRDGGELTRQEIRNFIFGLTSGEVADYQASALLMAIFFRGLSLNETIHLTEAMTESGEIYDLSGVSGFKADKHSTGGVGDKISIILAPLAAACGLKVPMMAGRGLGHSGGTLDKLEAIKGMRINLSKQEFENTLSRIGCAIIGQSEKMVPADRKLYSLRDVTGTVECIPLIVASILSKKLAEGTNALVLDVKVGSGAFMRTKADAQKLAKTLLRVAKKMKLPCRAVLSDMNQPLGYSVGNALEVKEAIEVLKNEKPEDDLCSTDLKELTIHLCAHMLELGGLARNLLEGRKIAQDRLKDGSAWEIFKKLIKAQGGNPEHLGLFESTPQPSNQSTQRVVWKAKRKGYLNKMNAENIGRIVVDLGGGRKKVTDLINYNVGLVFHKKLGHEVLAGEPVATVYAPKDMDLASLENQFWKSIEMSSSRKSVGKLILDQM